MHCHLNCHYTCLYRSIKFVRSSARTQWVVLRGKRKFRTCWPHLLKSIRKKEKKKRNTTKPTASVFVLFYTKSTRVRRKCHNQYLFMPKITDMYRPAKSLWVNQIQDTVWNVELLLPNQSRQPAVKPRHQKPAQSTTESARKRNRHLSHFSVQTKSLPAKLEA